MLNKKIRSGILIGMIITAAVIAAVIFSPIISDMVIPVFIPPSYSKPSDKIVTDTDESIRIEETGRNIYVYKDDKQIWALPDKVLAQDFFYEDIDRDDRKELVILCWKRGRFGEHRPTWVKRDEIRWSQHIFIYEVENEAVVPKWMASDIGMKAASMEFRDGSIFITDTDGEITKWKWKTWGLEKL